ncbi:MAG: D-alanine--D-alanine ligase [Pseudomonadota bacterium]
MTSNPLTIGVLKGGASAEADVSRNSATQVIAALQEIGHTCHGIELDENCARELLALTPDVVFPALHGPPGEDGTVQGFLELLGLPYVGSGVHGSALAMDKAVAKHLFRQHNLPVADDIHVANLSDPGETVATITARFGERVVIKPLNQGSAIGVTPLPNGGDIGEALRTGLQFGPCLVEPYVMGREITVGVLDTDDGPVPHPVIEIVTASDEWYDYNNRYTAGHSEHIVPAVLSEATSQQLQSIAVRAHEALDMRDLSRADFIVTDSDEIYLLEVNSLPGMTPTSLYPDGARHLGYSFAQLMDFLVQRAYRRGYRRGQSS